MAGGAARCCAKEAVPTAEEAVEGGGDASGHQRARLRGEVAAAAEAGWGRGHVESASRRIGVAEAAEAVWKGASVCRHVQVAELRAELDPVQLLAAGARPTCLGRLRLGWKTAGRGAVAWHHGCQPNLPPQVPTPSFPSKALSTCARIWAVRKRTPNPARRVLNYSQRLQQRARAAAG